MHTDHTAPAQRPTFLTVLCILSFIGGLWGVVEGFRTGFTDKAQQDLEQARVEIEEAMGAMQGQESEFAQRIMEQGMIMAEQAAAQAKSLGIVGLVTSLISLLGVWMMWNLRKTGFWVYTLAALVGLIAPLYFLGFSTMAFIALGFGGLVSIVFIILYAVNLKHMR